VSSFRVVGSETLARPGFLAVDRLEVVAPGGARYERTVVRHPGAVVVVPVEPGGATVLLVRQYRAAIDRDLLEAPAGKRDVDGEPPAQTAARELDEEIGHRPGRLVELAEFHNSPGFCDEYTYLFAALDVEPTAARRAVGPEEEEMTVERVSLDDVDGLISTRELVDAKSIVGLLLTRRLLAGEYAGVFS
jgi:ADP-ribose pyrophosphatase